MIIRTLLPSLSLFSLSLLLFVHAVVVSADIYTDVTATNLLNLTISPWVSVNGNRRLALPECARDCVPIFAANSRCTSLNQSSSSSWLKCFCESPYLAPLFTQGHQCAFLCGRDSRNRITEFLTSDSICGGFPSPITPGKTIKESTPTPDTFTSPPSRAARWWNKFNDGKKFGITLGIILAFIVVLLAVIIFWPGKWLRYFRSEGGSGFWFWRVGRDVQTVLPGKKKNRGRSRSGSMSTVTGAAGTVQMQEH